MQIFGKPIGRLAAVAVLGLATAAVPLAGRAAAEPYEIYVIGELTGFNAFVGNAEVKTMLAYEQLVNKQGGIRGRPIKMIVKDSGSSPQVAVQFMNEAMAKKVPFVIGGGVVATCQAMAGALKDDGPLLYCWSSGVLPPPGSWLYSSGFSALDQMAIGVRYMRERGWTKVAAITSTDATGQDADRNLENVFGMPENKGVPLTIREHFNVNDVSVAAQLARMKQSGANALIAWTTGTGFGTILRGLRDAGMDLPVLTTGGNLSYPQLEGYKETIPSNLIFAGYPVFVPDALRDRALQRTVNQFIDMFKADNVRPDVGYAVAWDGISLIVNALKKIGLNATSAQIRDYINSQTAYTGSANGVMNFKAAPQRGLTKENIIVIRWDPQKDKFIPISAPGGMPLK